MNLLNKSLFYGVGSLEDLHISQIQEGMKESKFYNSSEHG
jgi:hypothetical protein